MRNNRMRASVQPSVTLFIPRVNIWKPEVAAVGLDKQRGNGPAAAVDVHVARGGGGH
jgi:hypothetical protein